MEKIKLSTIKLNPDNPRSITPTNLKKLMDSISEFTAMMYLRPIVVDETNIILGGNQRYLALKALKYKDIPRDWVLKADDLTEDEKKRFIIADNILFGHWDLSELRENWQKDDLTAWGMDTAEWEQEEEQQEPETTRKEQKTKQLITCPHCGEEFEL